MTVLALPAGSLFAGRYRIVRCIAQGGMGAVYEVIHLETERRRALKVMLPNMLQSAEMQTRFRQEARVTANIESEFIVDVFDAGIDAATQMPFLVMEMLRGEELDVRLKRSGRFEPTEVVTLLQQTAMALDKTHKASIVHRDLKPGNLFLTERDDGSPRIKVLDFGIAKLVAEGATNANATRSLGTPLYMAPEQFQIGQKVLPATDIYALGMIAYTLLVGHPYWADECEAGANVFSFAAKAIFGPPEAATARAGRRGVSLPPAFDAWFARATAVAQDKRFPTASSAVQGLAEALGIALGPSRTSTISEVIISPFAQQTAAPRPGSSPDIGWSPQSAGALGSPRTPERISGVPQPGSQPYTQAGYGSFPQRPSSPQSSQQPISSQRAAPQPVSATPYPGPVTPVSATETTTRYVPAALTAMGTSTGSALTSTAPGKSGGKGIALAVGITLGFTGVVAAAALFAVRGNGEGKTEAGMTTQAAMAVATPETTGAQVAAPQTPASATPAPSETAAPTVVPVASVASSSVEPIKPPASTSSVVPTTNAPTPPTKPTSYTPQKAPKPTPPLKPRTTYTRD